MISTKDVVTKYRPNRVNDITDQQIAYIPRLEEDQVECSMPYYIYEGRKVAVDPKKFMVFKLKFLRFNRNMNSIKRRNYRSCHEKLDVLVTKNILEPFMLFINKIFIAWSAISIVINNEDYYLIIDCNIDKYLLPLASSYEYIQIFSLPSTMKCIDFASKYKYPNLEIQPLLAFKSDGTYIKYSGSNKQIKYILIDTSSKRKNYDDGANMPISNIPSIHLNDSVNGARLYISNANSDIGKIKISEKNVFVFVDGLLNYGTLNKIKRARIMTEEINGKETTYLEFYYSDNTGSNNLPISIVGNLISVNDGNIMENSVFDIMLFVNSDFTSENLDNIMRISEVSRIDAVRNANNGVNFPHYIRLSRHFDLPINRYLNFGDHISQSEEFIAGYNPYLFNELVKSYSTIEIQESKGSDVLKSIAKAKNNDTLSIALNNDGMYEERILLFVNGLLHINHSIATLDKNTMSIPINSTISANDVVEIMRFKNVNNFEIGIIVNESDGFIYQYGALINDDMRLFCKTPSQSDYTYPENGFQQFEVEYTLEQNENGYAKIVLTDPFYYGKVLTIAYKNRFIYKNFKISRNGTNVINMGNYFKYCVDANRYMIFVNGRLLNRHQYNITIPCDPTSNSYQFFVYLNISLNRTDRVDIVYASTDLEDFLLQDELHPTGDIVVDRKNLDYPFSKELYMIWINGKKIPVSQLDDINTTCIRINKDQKTTINLRVIKYIKCSSLRDLISSIRSDWDNIFISGLSREEINTIIGKEDIEYTNTEPDYDNSTDTNELVTSISDNVLILSDTKNIMMGTISGTVGIFNDPSKTIQTSIENNILYINYGGSN